MAAHKATNFGFICQKEHLHYYGFEKAEEDRTRIVRTRYAGQVHAQTPPTAAHFLRVSTTGASALGVGYRGVYRWARVPAETFVAVREVGAHQYYRGCRMVGRVRRDLQVGQAEISETGVETVLVALLRTVVAVKWSPRSINHSSVRLVVYEAA